MKKYKIGDQWIETLPDGKRHMLKAAEGENCKGCAYGMMRKGPGLSDIHVCDREDDCPLEYSNTIIKDLGIVNEEGCLPDVSTGKYPEICDITHSYEYASLRKCWSCAVKTNISMHAAYGDTREEAIRHWNWRV